MVFAPNPTSDPVITRVSDTRLDVSWTNNEPSGHEYSQIEVYRWDNVTAKWTSKATLGGNATSYSDTSTSANRRYRYRTTVSNAAGGATAYSAYMQTTPAAPSGAAASKASPTSITVSWTNNSASGANYDYQTALEESVNGGAWTLVSTLAEGTASASRTGLTPGSSYQYRVRAKSTTGTTTYSAYSTTSTIQLTGVPAAPSAFTATRNTDTSFSLSWTDNPTATAPYDSLTVQRSDNLTAAQVIANLAGTATSVNDTGTVANRKYLYQVRANNEAGSSAWVDSAYKYTTPAAPSGADAKYTGGTQITVSWTNNASYSEHSIKVKPFKNGVAQTEQSVAAGTTSYNLTGIDVLASYYFEIRAVSTTGSLSSAIATSNTVTAAAPPNAPTNLSPTGVPADLARANVLSWTHSPSQDGSAQTKFEVQHRVSGAGSWTSTGAITSATSQWTLPAGTYANPNTIEWQVRTYGVHATAGAWSSTATITGSTTPTITRNLPGATLPTSSITVDWTYFDAESTAQAAWELKLYNGDGTTLIEERIGSDATDNVTFAYAATDGDSYQITLRVRDGSGLWSDLMTHSFAADFIPPAEVLVSADYDAESGVVVLTLNPTADDGGVTTFPASAVTIERQVYDPESEEYGPWETVAANIDPNATIIDTTAPIHEDGHYRVTTFSTAPSSYKPLVYTNPSSWEGKWMYVSGGDNFDVVCRMWANIELSWRASRDKALYYFAGRKKPVLYSGEAKEKVLSVAGLVAWDEVNGWDGSPPAQWVRLAQQAGPVLLRAPGQRRIYGSLSEVSVDRIHNGLHKVSFSIQEVYRP